MVIFSDSVDGYHWNGMTVVASQNAFWPNVFSAYGRLYVEWDSDGVSYSTSNPVDVVPTEYLALEYGVNRTGMDLNATFSPMQNVSDVYACYVDCFVEQN